MVSGKYKASNHYTREIFIAMGKKSFSKSFTKIAIGVVILLMVGLFSYCSVIHHYGPYHGKVVDIETNDPIEGAAVLAVYYTQQYTFAGAVHHYLDAQETLTDEKGEFTIPALTCLTFRPLNSFDSWPAFTIFKPGYGCFPRHAGTTSTGINEQWLRPGEHELVKLPRLKALEERRRNCRCIPTSVPDDKMKHFLYLRDLERMNLGLQPIFIKKRNRNNE